MVLQLAFVSPLSLSLLGSTTQRVQLSIVKASRINHTTPHRKEVQSFTNYQCLHSFVSSGSSLESNTTKKTENRGLDFRGKVKEREREMEEKDEVNQIEEHLKAGLMLFKYHEAHIRKSSAMARGRERDVVGEMEEKDAVNQIEEHVKAALMLIENYKARAAMSSPMASERTQIQAPDSDAKNLQLRLLSRLPDTLYTGDKAEQKLGRAIPVALFDKSKDEVVRSGPMSCAKLLVVAVTGNFDKNDPDDWTLEDFKSHVETDRDGKKLLTGNLEVSLNWGRGYLGELTFTDNTNWTQNKKIRLGVEVAPGFCEGIRVREAISNAFVVKDRRGRGCKKHALPAPDDEVWRLKNIRKGGKFHKKLNEAGIFIVRDILWKLKLSRQELREILGTGMFKSKWETLVGHAETCDLSGKYYVYYADNTKSSGVVVKNMFELSWLIEGGEYYSAENLSDCQKEFASTLKRNAWDNFDHIVKYDGPMPSHMNPSKRARSSQTDVVTGVPVPSPIRTPMASQAPVVGGVHSLIAGDGPATSSDPSEEAYESTDRAYEVPADPTFDPTEDLGGLRGPDPSEQAGGNISMGRDIPPGDEPPLQPAPDHSKPADGTNDLSVEDDCRMRIDMNPSERERSPPTDRLTWADIQPWAEENCGIDQQDSTLLGTPVASGDQAFVNQWPDVRDPSVPFDQQVPIPGQSPSDGHVREDADVDMEEVDSWLLPQPDSPEQADGTDDLSLECEYYYEEQAGEEILEDLQPAEEEREWRADDVE